MQALPDYYGILGIHQDAEGQVIAAAYRALAKKYHPDVGGASTSARFLEIQEAYEVLSDPRRRDAYDIQRRGRAPKAARASEGRGSTKDNSIGRARRDESEPMVTNPSRPKRGISGRMMAVSALGAVAVVATALSLWLSGMKAGADKNTADQANTSVTTQNNGTEPTDNPASATVVEEKIPSSDPATVAEEMLSAPTDIDVSKASSSEDDITTLAQAPRAKQIYDRIAGEGSAEPTGQKDQSRLPGIAESPELYPTVNRNEKSGLLQAPADRVP